MGERGETHVSQGVRTTASLLGPPSSTISDSDDEMPQRAIHGSNSHDADESLISIPHDERNILSDESSSDTDGDLYRMKIKSRKGLRIHPSRIKFELVKPNVGSQCDRNPHKRHSLRRNKCHCTFEQEKSAPFVASELNVPSQAVQFNRSPEMVESFQSSHDYQPRRFRSKVRNIFARFQAPSCSNAHKDGIDADVEKASTGNDTFYHFDRGTPAYFRTTDCPPQLVSDIIAQRTAYHATKFWAEFFGSINIGVTFIITFFLQLFRFILYTIRALIVGLLQTTSDYLLKPLLAVLFNGFLQPQFIFTQNIFQSIADMLEPLTKLMENAVRPLAECLRAFRIVEVKNLFKEPASARYRTYQGQMTV